jgi:hypothetical protein
MVHEMVGRNVENGERWALWAAAKMSKQLCCGIGVRRLASSSSAHSNGNADSCRRDHRDGQREPDGCWAAFGASTGKSARDLSLFTADNTARA